MASKDDNYWHTIFKAVVAEFRERANDLQDRGKLTEAQVWNEAARELELTNDQALRTAETAERIAKVQ